VPGRPLVKSQRRGDLVADLVNLTREHLLDAGIPQEGTVAVISDVSRRATWLFYASDEDRTMLLAPWLERAIGHEPAAADVWAKALVTATVRNSVLERLHSNSQFFDPQIRGLTAQATEIAETALARGEVMDHPMTRQVHQTFPRCTKVFASIGKAWGSSNQEVNYGPLDEEALPLIPPDRFSALGRSDPILGEEEIRDGRTPTVEATQYLQLCEIARGRGVFVMPSFTQIGRTYQRLFATIEGLVARGASVATVNYLITPGGGFQRVPPLLPDDGSDALSQLSIREGLAPEHAAALRRPVPSVDDWGRRSHSTGRVTISPKDDCPCGSGRQIRRCCDSPLTLAPLV
jgi:hypothetical protein